MEHLRMKKTTWDIQINYSSFLSVSKLIKLSRISMNHAIGEGKLNNHEVRKAKNKKAEKQRKKLQLRC
jgi:hypothetical protein